MKTAFRAAINLAFAAGLLLFVVVGTFAYRSIGELVNTGRAEGRASENAGRIDAIISDFRTVEASQRKFLLTANASDLTEYATLRPRVVDEIAVLRRRVNDAQQKRRLDQLDALVSQRIEQLEQALQARQQRGAAAARSMVGAAPSRKLSGEIDLLAQEFKAQGAKIVERRQADTEYTAGVAAYMIVWGGLFALTLLLSAMIVIDRHQAKRRAAEEALRASEAEMRLVTDAVPALIARLDRDERFGFHNRAFEQWFKISSTRFESTTLREVTGEETYRQLQPHIRAALAGGDERFDIATVTPDGRALDLAVNLIPRHDHAGRVDGLYALITDITELKKLDRLKSEFVSTVSHELRTPLTSIRSSLGLLAGGVTGVLPEAAVKVVEIARANCERLVRLINDILDIEKIESGKMALSLEVLDLANLVEQAVRSNEGFASVHGVALTAAPSAPGTRVRADGDRLTQVLTNLLSNACRFSPRGSVVEVEILRPDGLARVEVRDRGPGIAEAFRKRMFQRFSQADSSDSRHKGGTGLGLAISRTIVERHGGRIGFEPREGGGATFFFELPECSE